MPVVIVVVVAAVVGYLLYGAAVAFLSNGLLFYRERGGEVQQVHS